jgi:ATP-dependent helicase Lhr and Lhr-like helicase
MNKPELLKLATDWFKNQSWKPFAFQKQTWDAFLKGKNGLLNAPTGSGKTYALWVPIVLDYIRNNPDYKEEDKEGAEGDLDHPAAGAFCGN